MSGDEFGSYSENEQKWKYNQQESTTKTKGKIMLKGKMAVKSQILKKDWAEMRTQKIVLF